MNRAQGGGERILTRPLTVVLQPSRTDCQKRGRGRSRVVRYHVVANVLLSRSSPIRGWKTLDYNLLPVQREHKSNEGVTVLIDSTGNFGRFEMERAEGLSGGLCKSTDTAGEQDGGAGGISSR